MDFSEFYKELEAEFLRSGAKIKGMQLLQLELKLGKIPSRSSRPVKLAKNVWQFGLQVHLGFHLLMMVLKASGSPPYGCVVNLLVDFLYLVMAHETKQRIAQFFAIGECHLPIESTIANRSTNVMVEPQ
nr:hypothetical protein [Tanacetum cinerariifolium]